MNESTAPLLELSVGEFAQRLERWIKRRPELLEIGIRGEVSGWAPQPNANVYFKLKDAQAVLECFAFANSARRFPVVEEGSAVVAIGSVEIRGGRSQYQLLVSSLQLHGTGKLYAQYQALREQFAREGLFAAERKRPIPSFPKRIALVSADGLGAEDFRNKLAREAPFVQVTFIETRVQGTGAEIEIADALDRACRLAVDVVVLTRGGGSFEDLFPFNLEPVVRAIVRAPIPVITALAHTRNRYLADEASDLSAETPTAAAVYVAALWKAGFERLSHLKERLGYLIDVRLMRATQSRDAAREAIDRCALRLGRRYRERMTDLERRLERSSPRSALAAQRERTRSSAVRLDEAARHVLAATSARGRLLQASLDALNPEAPLARGYAIVLKDGRSVRDASDVAIGDTIEAVFERGRAGARVESVLRDE